MVRMAVWPVPRPRKTRPGAISLMDAMAEAVTGAEVILLGNSAAADAKVLAGLRPEQFVLDLTSAAHIPPTPARYERIAS